MTAYPDTIRPRQPDIPHYRSVCLPSRQNVESKECFGKLRSEHFQSVRAEIGVYITSIMSPANRSSYRVVIPLNGFTRKTLAEAVIPAGSRVEWQTGDYAGGLAHVHWGGREFLVIEGELLKQCQRA
jgi:hypothetical protein